MSLDPADTIEPTETLDLLAGWLASDPARRTPSLLDYVGHPAYGPQQLRQDLDRFTFLRGGSDGEELFGPGQQQARPGGATSSRHKLPRTATRRGQIKPSRWAKTNRPSHGQLGSGRSPGQLRLANFLAHVDATAAPMAAAAAGRLSVELIVGFLLRCH